MGHNVIDGGWFGPPCVNFLGSSSLHNFDDGIVLDYANPVTGGPTLPTMACQIHMLRSGEKTKSELAGIGDEEFAPWQLGPTL